MSRIISSLPCSAKEIHVRRFLSTRVADSMRNHEGCAGIPPTAPIFNSILDFPAHESFTLSFRVSRLATSALYSPMVRYLCIRHVKLPSFGPALLPPAVSGAVLMGGHSMPYLAEFMESVFESEKPRTSGRRAAG